MSGFFQSRIQIFFLITAELLDLDFSQPPNSAPSNSVTVVGAAENKSYSTREPLRPSIESARNYDSETTNLSHVSQVSQAASSNSSTASNSSGSRRASAASSRAKQENQSALDSSGSSVLRDTKIEIAGKLKRNVLRRVILQQNSSECAH